jgi:hypothetical protein
LIFIAGPERLREQGRTVPIVIAPRHSVATITSPWGNQAFGVRRIKNKDYEYDADENKE